MYKCFNSFETESMFDRVYIRIAKSNREKVEARTVFVCNLEPSMLNDCEVLSFCKFNNDKRVLITELKRVPNDVSALKDVFFTVCEKTIEKFISLAQLSEFTKLTIFTPEPVIQEILLKKRFQLKAALDNNSVVASLTLNQK